MKILTVLFFVLLAGSLAAMWARNNGLDWANPIAVYLGTACALVGIGLFIAQAVSFLSRDRKKD